MPRFAGRRAGLALTALVASCAASLVACGSSDTGSTSSSGTTASADPSGSVPEDLTFTGVVSGHMTEGRRGPVFACAGGSFAPSGLGGSGQLAIGPIVGAVGGTDYQINIVMLNYHGPGTYAVSTGFFSLTPNSDASGSQLLTSNAGTFVVNKDGRSGTADMDLHGTPGAAHVKGSWTCPPDF